MIKVKYLQNILMTLLLEAVFFYKIRKEYSKLCREFKQDLISKIDSLHQNAPNQCWEILNSLRNDYQDSTDSKITPEEWVSHFSNLNKTKQEYTNRVEVINELLKQKEKIKQYSNLDFKISDQEILKALNSLKTGKSKGLDGICNEMMKGAKDSIIPCLNKIFNLILLKSFYPKHWKISFIKPIFGVLSNRLDIRGLLLNL